MSSAPETNEIFKKSATALFKDENSLLLIEVPLDQPPFHLGDTGDHSDQ